jgi:hypothetical protein
MSCFFTNLYIPLNNGIIYSFFVFLHIPFILLFTFIILYHKYSNRTAFLRVQWAMLDTMLIVAMLDTMLIET